MTQRLKSLWNRKLPFIPAMLICLGTAAPFEPRIPSGASESAESRPFESEPEEESPRTDPTGSTGKYGCAVPTFARAVRSVRTDPAILRTHFAESGVIERPAFAHGFPGLVHRECDRRNGIGAPLRC